MTPRKISVKFLIVGAKAFNIDISIQISKYPLEKVNEALCECAEAFIHFTNFFIRMMEGAAISKSALDKKLDEEEQDGD